jgi:signal transduction histidine kinase
MTTLESRTLVHRREVSCSRLALAASAFVALAASSVLVGWIIDNETLKHFALGSVVMIPVTVVTLLLAAVALAILTIDSTSRVWRWSGRLVSGLVLVLGATMLAQRLGGFELRMNLLLFADALSRYPYRPLGLMAGNSAVAFTLLGIGLAFPDVCLRDRRVANGVALGAVAVSATALVGYSFGARALYSFDQYAAMAVSTAMCLLAIGIGLIASRPQSGLAALLIADDAGGVFTRRMLPIALTVPFLLGLAWLTGRRMELISRESGVANFVVAIAAIYSAFLFHSARSVSKLDREARASLDHAERARVRAEEANRGKAEFLTMMSHELRTPLNAIRGYTQLMELGVHGPVTEEQRMDLARIRRSEEHLLGILGDILEFASIERGHYKYEIARVALPPLLDDVASEVMSLAVVKGVRLVKDWRPAGGENARDPMVTMDVLADAEKLRQALINLVSNAIKFANAGGHVTIALQPSQKSIQLSIANSDRDIPPDRHATLFDPFTQLEPALTRTTAGIGLGLAVSRQLLRGMGSDVQVESTPGAGWRFSILLPRAPLKRFAAAASTDPSATRIEAPL